MKILDPMSPDYGFGNVPTRIFKKEGQRVDPSL